jgi:hypothetical protein
MSALSAIEERLDNQISALSRTVDFGALRPDAGMVLGYAHEKPRIFIHPPCTGEFHELL